MRKTERITVRITENEKQMLNVVAAGEKRTPPDLVRLALINYYADKGYLKPAGKDTP